MAFLELRDVSKSYGSGADRLPVLDGVRLAVEEGECLAIVGAPHSGKSTLLGLVAGLILPDFGALTLAGRPIVGPGPDRLFVAPACALYSWLSVMENLIRAVESANPTWSKEAARHEAERLLDATELTDLARKKPDELSVVARKRAALARTLALNPDVLLLDEPFAGLDSATRAVLQRDTARMLAGVRKTCLLATDDVEEALLLADRAVLLGSGSPSHLSLPLTIDLPRPRDRGALQRGERFEALRELLVAPTRHDEVATAAPIAIAARTHRRGPLAAAAR